MGEPQFIPHRLSEDPGVSPLLQSHDGPHGLQLSHNGNQSDNELTGSACFKSTATAASAATQNIDDSLPNVDNSRHMHADSAPPQVKEDDGWILSVGFDAKQQQSEVVILDAAHIEAGPVATLPLITPVGYGIHGTWVPFYYGP